MRRPVPLDGRETATPSCGLKKQAASSGPWATVCQVLPPSCVLRMENEGRPPLPAFDSA
jgi:hypothetical protein